MTNIIKQQRFRIGLLICLTLTAACVGVLLDTDPASTQTPPISRLLPWENPDGSLNHLGIPDSMSTVDCLGRVVGSVTQPFERVYRPLGPDGGSCAIGERRYNDDAEGASEGSE